MQSCDHLRIHRTTANPVSRIDTQQYLVKIQDMHMLHVHDSGVPPIRMTVSTPQRFLLTHGTGQSPCPAVVWALVDEDVAEYVASCVVCKTLNIGAFLRWVLYNGWPKKR